MYLHMHAYTPAVGLQLAGAAGIVHRLRSAGDAAEPPRPRARMAFEVRYSHKQAAILVYSASWH